MVPLPTNILVLVGGEGRGGEGRGPCWPSYQVVVQKFKKWKRFQLFLFRIESKSKENDKVR